jgi:drug/metabolite transporter (DMT)-like permease
MFWQALVIGIALLPVVLVAKDPTYSPRNLALVAVLGIFFTALPHTLFTMSFKHLSAKTVSILATLLPLYAAVLGYLIHKETVAPRTMVGGAIILSCVIYETVRSTRPK